MRNKAAKAYLRAVRRRLVCGRDSRARLIRRLEQMTDDLLEEAPDADLSAAFGPPEALAADMLGTCPEAELCRARTRRTWMRRGLAAALVLVAVASCVFGVYMKKTKGGRVEIVTTIYKDGPRPSATPDPDAIFHEEWGIDVNEEATDSDTDTSVLP